MRKFLEDSFPQLDLSLFVADEELDRFAKSKGGLFPMPQHANSMTATLNDGGPDSAGDQGTKGVVLVGDALHSFPPDLGQGVNSGLEDVLELNKVSPRVACKL